MNKKKIFYSYTDFTTLQSIGAGWVAQLKGYLPIGDWIKNGSLYWVALGAIGINWLPFWLIIVFLAVKFYGMIFVNWWIGRKAIKIGVYEAQQQYNAKTEHLSPYNRECIAQWEAIGEKLGVKSKFSKL